MKSDLPNQTAKVLLAIHSVLLIAFVTLFSVYELWHFYLLLFR